MRANRLAAFAVLVASLATLLMVATGALAQDPSDGSPYELPFPPTPTPTPEPTPTATPDDEERPRLRLLSPTPTVRIIGRLTRAGARVTRLTVRTPPLTRIVVRCSGKGRGCPAPQRTTVVPDSERRLVTYRLKPFERTYEAGAKLELAVARKGTIGKYASFAIRRGKAPRRRDACIDYGAKKPRACPKLDD